MREAAQRRAGRGALLALLLQLLLPLFTVQQAAARPGDPAGFVICTGAGLVWITPDGVPASDGDGDPDSGYHCPICLGKQLAMAALLPSGPLLQPAPWHIARTVLPGKRAMPVRASAPPLPARGPPLSA